jgi:hypothetical protein
VAANWALPFDTAYAVAAWASWLLPLAAIGAMGRMAMARVVPSNSSRAAFGADHRRALH